MWNGPFILLYSKVTTPQHAIPRVKQLNTIKTVILDLGNNKLFWKKSIESANKKKKKNRKTLVRHTSSNKNDEVGPNANFLTEKQVKTIKMAKNGYTARA